MALEYKVNAAITVEQFIDLLNRSTLGERRPVADRACMEGMVKNANLCVTAWDGEKLVGVARSVTDFHYACYLSDLAVDAACGDGHDESDQDGEAHRVGVAAGKPGSAGPGSERRERRLGAGLVSFP